MAFQSLHAVPFGRLNLQPAQFKLNNMFWRRRLFLKERIQLLFYQTKAARLKMGAVRVIPSIISIYDQLIGLEMTRTGI
jgi:hypothetical protein